jgi:hypothetical protein
MSRALASRLTARMRICSLTERSQLPVVCSEVVSNSRSAVGRVFILCGVSVLLRGSANVRIDQKVYFPT